jgi:predicted CoA-substrate-specific enzyme activase
MIFAGIDAGSRSIKVALVDTELLNGGGVLVQPVPFDLSTAGATAAPDIPGILGLGVMDQGIEQDARAGRLFEEVLDRAGAARADVRAIVATGYGRNLIRFANATITEITCHARGVHHLAPEAATVIEIGGQDSKMIRLGPNGQVRDFAMNDRCAAGTGRFLEVVATRLGVELSALGELARRSTRPASISSMCVVFAETEIIGLLASGHAREDIVAGVQAAIAARVAAMAGRRIEPPVIFTGGVAMVPGMAEALEDALGQAVARAPLPLMTGALGAAILAATK